MVTAFGVVCSVNDEQTIKIPATMCCPGYPEPGTIHIGHNGNPSTHWICFRHYRAWHDTLARCLVAGLPCEM